MLVRCAIELPPVEVIRTISVLPPKISLSSLPIGCMMTYSLNGKYNKLDDRTQHSAVSQAFTLLQDSYQSLRFTDVSSQNLASNINIYFVPPSDSVKYKQVVFDNALLESYTEELSTVSQKGSREFVIYINSAYSWTPQQITRMVLFHVGYILGLSVSSDESSIMYPKLTALPNKIGDFDNNNIKKIYSSGCRIWLENNNTFPQNFNTYWVKFFKINERLFALSEDNYPKFNLFEFNINKLLWEQRKGLIMQSTDFGLDIDDLFVMSVGSQGLVGIATSFFSEKEESGEVWNYNPDKNEWTNLPNVQFPKKYQSFNRLYSFGSENKGYVVVTTNDRIDVWQFDSEAKTWKSTSTLSTTQNTYTISFLANNKYFYGFWEYLETAYRFDLLKNTWTNIPNTKIFGIGTFTNNTFVNGDDAYVVIGSSKYNPTINNSERQPYQIWTFSMEKGPAAQWELLATTPESTTGKYIENGFVVNNRIFLFTNERVLLEYLP